jgi:hypothetical protein
MLLPFVCMVLGQSIRPHVLCFFNVQGLQGYVYFFFSLAGVVIIFTVLRDGYRNYRTTDLLFATPSPSQPSSLTKEAIRQHSTTAGNGRKYSPGRIGVHFTVHRRKYGGKLVYFTLTAMFKQHGIGCTKLAPGTLENVFCFTSFFVSTCISLW